jgi:hypothetical protein
MFSLLPHDEPHDARPHGPEEERASAQEDRGEEDRHGVRLASRPSPFVAGVFFAAGKKREGRSGKGTEPVGVRDRSAMSVRVKKFNPSSIRESRVIFIIGKRNTGKSILMKDLLYHMPRPDYVVAMAPTEDTLRMYREFLPEGCIFDHFSQEKLDRIVSLQRELVARGTKRTVLIILDDCLYQKGVLKSTAMRSIFYNGRHDNISLICAAQYMMDVDVSLRTNIDYIFTMRENILLNRQKLYKYFFGQFSKFDEFDKVMTACTQDYKTLVLDGTVASTEATDCVLWYKAAVEVPPFRLCKDIFWGLSAKYGISHDQVRAAQVKQFQIETAAADIASAGRPRAAILVVQTEDEAGNVVP